MHIFTVLSGQLKLRPEVRRWEGKNRCQSASPSLNLPSKRKLDPRRRDSTCIQIQHVFWWLSGSFTLPKRQDSCDNRLYAVEFLGSWATALTMGCWGNVFSFSGSSYTWILASECSLHAFDDYPLLLFPCIHSIYSISYCQERLGRVLFVNFPKQH